MRTYIVKDEEGKVIGQHNTLKAAMRTSDRSGVFDTVYYCIFNSFTPGEYDIDFLVKDYTYDEVAETIDFEDRTSIYEKLWYKSPGRWFEVLTESESRAVIMGWLNGR